MITTGVSSTNPMMCRPASISVSAAIRPIVRSASKPTKIQSKRGALVLGLRAKRVLQVRTRAQESSGADKSLKEAKVAESSEKSVDEPEGSMDSQDQISVDKYDSKEKAGLVEGVMEEVALIEWPQLGQALGSTALVLALVAGSGATLYGLNLVLSSASTALFD